MALPQSLAVLGLTALKVFFMAQGSHSSWKILLTGGSGFIGRNILESYLGAKYQLVAPSHAVLDLGDGAAVDRFWQDKQFEVVIHAATKPGHRNAPDPDHILAANLLYLENLLRHQDKFKKFIHLGSGAIYDLSLGHHQVTEDQIGRHLSANQTTLSKYIIQQRLKSLPAAVDLNIFGIFGKYEDWQIRFISNAICKALYRLPITLRQNRRFSYLYIDDLMPILDFFIQDQRTGFATYNVTPPGYVELLQVAQLVQRLGPYPVEIKLGQTGYGLDYNGDSTHLRQTIGNLKFTPLEDAIKCLFAYYKIHLDQIDRQALLFDK